ncbi:hypothetical protein CGSSp14BS69_02779 [Streptococcus pneumoniae SP14-BS69]|nr:hypothetical protein CGSSp14BS69_02779 [Streptococcus pneumoniae SP14-BS69]
MKVRYVDEQGRLLSLKNDTGIGEKKVTEPTLPIKNN